MTSLTTIAKTEEKWHLEPLKSVRHGWIGQIQADTETGRSKMDSVLGGAHVAGITVLPNLGSMQRAPTPWQYNSPIRSVELAKDVEESRLRSVKKLHNLKQPLPENYIRRIRRKVQQSSAKNYVHDLALIAQSSSRAGQVESAAQAYHKIGVAYDNMGKYKEANDNYHQCLALCMSSSDKMGEALAYNCLGINYYKMGKHQEAIKCHNKHLELADPSGRILAHTNLGLVFTDMGQFDHASIHHQHAIEYANRVNSTKAQTLAVGNLGVSALSQGDSETSRACLQYHMAMGKGTGDSEENSKFTKLARDSAKNDALHKLGELSINEGKLEEAAGHFGVSVELARKLKDQEMEQKSSVMLGVSHGLMHLDLHQQALLATARVE